MVKTSPPPRTIRLFSIFALIFVAVASAGYPARSLPAGSPTKGGRFTYNAPPPPDQGAPGGRRQGGASRDGACASFESLTALAPMSQDKVWGLTVSDRPTFWFYVPTTITAVPIEFVLQDEADNYVYQTKFNAPVLDSGVISVAVPQTAPALEVGKIYRWTFSVGCGANHSSGSVFVQGALQRVTPSANLQEQLQQASPIDKVSIYAANGIWYEALTLLATLRQANPNDSALSAAWRQLLLQENLEAIALSPIVPCCTSIQSAVTSPINNQ